MPELAEVEYFRRCWDAGMGDRVVKILLHARKRVFRGTNTRALCQHLTNARLLRSEARGKRMLFRFSGNSWLGLHLGMSGKLRAEHADFCPRKHDHLVLYQRERALVFTDPRQFGRVQFHYGQTPPDWWNDATPEIDSPQFNRSFFDDFLNRHRRAPIKAVLLMQSGFSGIGNWMADEILWRARVLPSKIVTALTAKERAALFRATRFVARASLRLMAPDLSDPPKSWLIHQRWRSGGKCPRHGTILRRATIAGRTTAWCPKCQR
jgi:formamidopyrimidine-DNA glycosylase